MAGGRVAKGRHSVVVALGGYEGCLTDGNELAIEWGKGSQGRWQWEQRLRSRKHRGSSGAVGSPAQEHKRYSHFSIWWPKGSAVTGSGEVGAGPAQLLLRVLKLHIMLGLNYSTQNGFE